MRPLLLAYSKPLIPLGIYSYLKLLPGVLTAAVDPAVRKAGVVALCTFIGPVPEAGGQIVATTWVLCPNLAIIALLILPFFPPCPSCPSLLFPFPPVLRLQFGDSEGTPLFTSTWPGHEELYMEHLGRFVRKYEFRELQLCFFPRSAILKSI